MQKNITIKISAEAALWARRKAAEENTSVSKLVGQMLERQMLLTDQYWAAYQDWKALPPVPGVDASLRLSRQEAHDRR